MLIRAILWTLGSGRGAQAPVLVKLTQGTITFGGRSEDHIRTRSNGFMCLKEGQ